MNISQYFSVFILLHSYSLCKMKIKWSCLGKSVHVSCTAEPRWLKTGQGVSFLFCTALMQSAWGAGPQWYFPYFAPHLHRIMWSADYSNSEIRSVHGCICMWVCICFMLLLKSLVGNWTYGCTTKKCLFPVNYLLFTPAFNFITDIWKWWTQISLTPRCWETGL